MFCKWSRFRLDHNHSRHSNRNKRNIAITGQATETGDIPSLTANEEYRVRIRSKKTLATPSDTQYSDWTNSQNATPELSYPANFETNAQTTTSVTVQWTQNTDATGGYIVQYCTASSTNCDQAGTGSDWTSTTTAGQKGQVAETATATTSTTISSLNSGITYRARIQSIQTTPSAQSPWSTPIEITTLPASPTPTSSSKTTTAFTVNWTKPTGTKTGAGAFEYSYCQHHATNCTTTGTGSSYPNSTTAPDTKLQETITGRTPATQYNFRIRAVKTLNATDYKSPWATISILTNPPTPTLTFGSRTTTAITVNWTAITGANNGYRVEYCKSSVNCDTAQTGSDWGGAQTNTATKGSTDISTQATISTQFTSLTTDSTYLFRIASKAEGSSNTITSQSSWSSTFTAIPTANPSPPTALTAGTATTTTIPLTWTAPATVPSGGYQIQHCENHSTTCTSTGTGTDWSTATITDASSTSHTLTLTTGTTYNIRIRSVKTSTPNAYSALDNSNSSFNKIRNPNKPPSFNRSKQQLTLCFLDCGDRSNFLQNKNLRSGLFNWYKLERRISNNHIANSFKPCSGNKLSSTSKSSQTFFWKHRYIRLDFIRHPINDWNSTNSINCFNH